MFSSKFCWIDVDGKWYKRTRGGTGKKEYKQNNVSRACCYKPNSSNCLSDLIAYSSPCAAAFVHHSLALSIRNFN